jgi:hypothetical protein
MTAERRYRAINKTCNGDAHFRNLKPSLEPLEIPTQLGTASYP